MGEDDGAPGTIRTSDPQIRSLRCEFVRCWNRRTKRLTFCVCVSHCVSFALLGGQFGPKCAHQRFPQKTPPITPPTMNRRGTAISQMAASRCPATTLIPPQPSVVPPGFDRFPLTLGPGETAPPLRAPETRYIARLFRGFAGLTTKCRSPLKRSKSGATLTRCRSQSSRRSYAALLGRTAVPTVAGEYSSASGPADDIGWRSHGAQMAPSEGAFPCRRESARCIISAPLRGASDPIPEIARWINRVCVCASGRSSPTTRACAATIASPSDECDPGRDAGAGGILPGAFSLNRFPRSVFPSWVRTMNAHVAERERLPFNRDMFRWARERRELTVEEAAKRANVRHSHPGPHKGSLLDAD